MTLPKPPKRRIRRARPLLVAAAGAVILAVAGCGDNNCNGLCADQGLTVDMAATSGDMGIPAVPPDMKRDDY